MIPERLALKKATAAEVHEFCELCNSIEEGVAEKREVGALLEKWNLRANRPYSAREFTDYSAAVDQEVFVRRALAPAARLVGDLTYPELRAVFEAVFNATLSEAESSYFLDWLEVQLPDSDISDLIFWPDQWFEVTEYFEHKFTPDELIRAAMEGSGRILPDAPPVASPFPRRKPRRVLVTPPPAGS